MPFLILSVLARIFSNSCSNVLQKILTKNGVQSSVVNFYTYLGLTLVCTIPCHTIIITKSILINILIMGLLGSLGNFFIIKALSYGELSYLAPINSYKPVVALIFGVFLLNEVPTILDVLAILIIILGTFFLSWNNSYWSKAYFLRFIALIFSGTEAIFIKKVINLTDINTALFYWAFFGLLFSILFIVGKNLKLNKTSLKNQLLLIIMVGIMQYTTNYVFSKINVAYALALFQLSTIFSVFLGINIFKERGLFRKLIASIIMICGALIIILR